MTTVYLVRHAHSHWEPNEDRPLSDQGRPRARDLAGWFVPIPLSAIYSSPARRAIETIQPLADARNIRPEIVDDLRERTLIVRPGETVVAAAARAWRNPEAGEDGMESNRTAASRALRVLRRIVAEREGGSVVVSTHGNLLTLVLNALDPAYGYETWLALGFPDVYRLTFQKDRLLRSEHVWNDGNHPRGGARA
jgi:2,3-bisphosphoglycerate-dependent phosphoglycerate mutase